MSVKVICSEFKLNFRSPMATKFECNLIRLNALGLTNNQEIYLQTPNFEPKPDVGWTDVSSQLDSAISQFKDRQTPSIEVYRA